MIGKWPASNLGQIARLTSIMHQKQIPSGESGKLTTNKSLKAILERTALPMILITSIISSSVWESLGKQKRMS